MAITIHNFPEGMAVALPLRSECYTPLQAFKWATLTGLVEPVGGLVGASLATFSPHRRLCPHDAPERTPRLRRETKPTGSKPHRWYSSVKGRFLAHCPEMRAVYYRQSVPLQYFRPLMQRIDRPAQPIIRPTATVPIALSTPPSSLTVRVPIPHRAPPLPESASEYTFKEGKASFEGPNKKVLHPFSRMEDHSRALASLHFL